MQPASAAEIRPEASLLGKTPQLLETLLGTFMKIIHSPATNKI